MMVVSPKGRISVKNGVRMEEASPLNEESFGQQNDRLQMQTLIFLGFQYPIFNSSKNKLLVKWPRTVSWEEPAAFLP